MAKSSRAGIRHQSSDEVAKKVVIEQPENTSDGAELIDSLASLLIEMAVAAGQLSLPSN